MNDQEGYLIIELQIGAAQTTDFIHGKLLQTFLERKVQGVHTQVPSLTQVGEAPIAVQSNSPSSGLFSTDKFSSLPILLDAIRRDIEATGGQDRYRRLFLVPNNAQVLKLETENSVVHQIVVAYRG